MWMMIWFQNSYRFFFLQSFISVKCIVADISFSNADSGDQEKISGPRGDDYTVYRDAARRKEPSRLHPQADCFDHPRG